jgi:hypothetical protein
LKGDAEIEYEEKILLQEALECGNLGVDVLDIVETMKKKKVQDIHPYTITAPANEKGRWQTFIKDEEKGTGAEHHNSYFDIDESVLYKGAASAVTYAIKFLQSDIDTSERRLKGGYEELNSIIENPLGHN